jgi:hypothetical protein
LLIASRPSGAMMAIFRSACRQVDAMCLLHGARVEGRDLVVVGVGDDDRLRRVGRPVRSTSEVSTPQPCSRAR